MAHDEERARLVSELQEGESRLARLREAAAVVRDVPIPQPVQPDPGAQVARLEEMVKVLQDERDALLATRAGSCGGFPLPDNLSELSTLVEVKTRELTSALVQEDGDKVARLSSVLATIGHKINVVQNGSTEQDVKRRAVSNGPITSMVANRVS